MKVLGIKNTSIAIKIIIVIIMIMLWLFGIAIYLRKGRELREEYRLIQKGDEINSIVLDLKKIKGGSFIKTKNASIRLLPSQNHLYKDDYLHNNLFLGDSISKDANCDTIFIFSSEGEVKYFIHNEVINRPR